MAELRNDQCYTWVYATYGRSQCRRAGHLAEDGHRYCKQHDPVILRAKRDAQAAQDEARSRENAIVHAAVRRAALALGVGQIASGMICLTADQASTIASRLGTPDPPSGHYWIHAGGDSVLLRDWEHDAVMLEAQRRADECGSEVHVSRYTGQGEPSDGQFDWFRDRMAVGTVYPTIMAG